MVPNPFVTIFAQESVNGGGGSSEDSEREIGREDSGEEEWQQALSVGGLGMSMEKGELASLIHQGARAILPTQVSLLLLRWLLACRVLQTRVGG